MELCSLIPQNKSDLARATAAVSAGYPSVAPVLSQLFEWLQDYNWPVARVLAPFLGSIGKPVIPQVRHVLESDDDIWKYNVLSHVVANSPEVIMVFRYDLERYAKAATPNESAEGLDEVAREILRALKQST